MKKFFSTLLAVGGILVMLALVLLSPLIFLSLGSKFRNSDLQSISLIGQSYGFAAAVLSAFAFFGIVMSLRLQRIELRSSREQNARTSHQDLLHLAISDEDVMQVWRFVSETVSDAEVKKRLYVNMIFSHWEVLYHLGMMGDVELRANSRSIFENNSARYFWSISRLHRRNVASTKIDKRFIELIDHEFTPPTP